MAKEEAETFPLFASLFYLGTQWIAPTSLMTAKLNLLIHKLTACRNILLTDSHRDNVPPTQQASSNPDKMTQGINHHCKDSSTQIQKSLHEPKQLSIWLPLFCSISLEILCIGLGYQTSPLKLFGERVICSVCEVYKIDKERQ